MENVQINQREHKGRNLTICIMFGILIFGITIATLITPDKTFSSNENRALAGKPVFSWEKLVDGEFTKDYESYITDQFIMRDKWIALKVYSEVAMQRKDINGVFLGKDGYYIQKYTDTDIDEELVEKNINRLQQFIKQQQVNVQVMIAPTASEVLEDKLPKYAIYYNSQPMVQKIKDTVGENQFINVKDELLSHNSEYVYYKTDHHWTSLGAYYAYTAWAKQNGITPYAMDEFTIDQVTDSFYGTTYSKVNIPMKGDSIELYHLNKDITYDVVINQQLEMDGLYDLSKLKEKDKYPVFLGGNNAYVDIKTNVHNGKKLLVIKDSYAHSMVSFLANHYEEIIMLDYRYYNGPTSQLIQDEGITDVLILYNTINFAQDKYFGKLLK